MKDNVEKWVKDAVNRAFRDPYQFTLKAPLKALTDKQRRYYNKLRTADISKEDALKQIKNDSLQ